MFASKDGLTYFSGVSVIAGKNLFTLIVLKYFFLRQNKLECFSLAIFFYLVKYLLAKLDKRYSSAVPLTKKKCFKTQMPSIDVRRLFPSLPLMLLQNKLACLYLAIIFNLVKF
jgi:hypothetical protein